VLFGLRYSWFGGRLVARLGAGPGRAGVDVTDRELLVIAGPWFRLGAPRSSIVAVRRDSVGRRWGVGVHGWRGRWVVNGSREGIVRIDLDPPARARTIVFPLRVRVLWVGVEEPDALVAALRG
jgi:hypothetical protein